VNRLRLLERMMDFFRNYGIAQYRDVFAGCLRLQTLKYVAPNVFGRVFIHSFNFFVHESQNSLVSPHAFSVINVSPVDSAF